VDAPALAKAMVSATVRVYVSRDERAAIRCALGDAAHLCDAIVADILKETATKHGKETERGRQLAAIAKRCGDAIWAMRDDVHCPDPIPSPAPAEPPVSAA
jgi:hypothetical protein